MSPDRRKSDRFPASVEAACHFGGLVRRTRLTDITTDGCRATLAFSGAMPGDRVVLKLTDLLALPATIVWIYEEQAGLEFSNPMFGAMLTQFLLHHGKRHRLH